MRVVVAVDSFKGTITATDAAAAVGAGWRSVRPDDRVEAVPMADGGEGSAAALAAAHPGGTPHPVRVLGPDGRSVDAAWLALPDGRAVVELAAASGLPLLAEPAPETAHAFGFGQLLRAATESGAASILACIGGSASTDAGVGVLAALGGRFLDEDGEEVPLGSAGLDRLRSVDLSDLVPRPRGGVTVITDVDAPLVGPGGAVRGYGPQKGVRPEDFDRVERRLRHVADLLGLDGAVPGSGAAGGIGLGLRAWGARLEIGSAFIAAEVGLAARIADADAVITGEGRFDEQTAAGKVVEQVRTLAAAAGKPVHLVAGRIEAPTAGFDLAVELTALAGSASAAMADPARWLRDAGALLATGSR